MAGDVAAPAALVPVISLWHQPSSSSISNARMTSSVPRHSMQPLRRRRGIPTHLICGYCEPERSLNNVGCMTSASMATAGRTDPGAYRMRLVYHARARIALWSSVVHTSGELSTLQSSRHAPPRRSTPPRAYWVRGFVEANLLAPRQVFLSQSSRLSLTPARAMLLGDDHGQEERRRCCCC